MADRHPTGEAVSDDLEKRLRDWSESMNLYQEESDDLNNAADELARLRSENEALKKNAERWKMARAILTPEQAERLFNTSDAETVDANMDAIIEALRKGAAK